MLTGDFHTHGSFSHGKGSAMENARVAHEKGLKSIAITEHGLSTFAGSLRKKEILDAQKEVFDAQTKFSDVKIYFGIEANLVSPDGEIDIPKSLLDQFEVVLVGLHVFVRGTKYMRVVRIVWRNAFRILFRHRDKLRAINTKALVKAMYEYDVDALAHLGTSMPDFDIVAVAKAAEETDTCIEINNKHCSLSLEQLKYLATTNVKFLLNSDAHLPENVGNVANSLEMAREAGINFDNILNYNKEYIPKKFRKAQS